MSFAHRARKRYGQNFLTDANATQRIIDHIAASSTDHIVEIGPGKGALTQSLLHSGATLDAIEIDRDLVALLTEQFKPFLLDPTVELRDDSALSTRENAPALTIHETDALKFDLKTLAPKPFRIVGNLPYNISTPLLFHLFNSIDDIQDMHLMLQTEVAHRMAAKPHTKAYGRLSVMTQYYCQVTLLFNVDNYSFTPQPKVSSTVLQLKPHAKSLLSAQDPALLEEIVRHAFSQRRKYLSNVLKAFVSADEISQLGLDPHARAEHLSPDCFVKICNYVSQKAPKD